MKLSISNIAWPKEYDNKVYKLCKEMGYQGLEVSPTRILGKTPFQSLEKALRFQNMIKSEYNLEISSLQSIWYGQTGFLFKDDYEKLCKHTQQAIEFAGNLKINNLVFGSPQMRKVYHPDDYRKGLQFFAKIADWAETSDTVFSIEANPAIYGTNYINYTLEAMAIVRYIGSKHLKVSLDIGTIISKQEEIDEIESNIDLINHVHISEPYLELIKSREIHKKIFSILRRNNYKGYVSIEMKRRENIEDVIKTMEYVKRL